MMNRCAQECVRKKEKCKIKECRLWINHNKDLNCTLVAINNSKGPMTLDEVSKRLNLSLVRIKQIQDKAIQKLKKNAPLLK